MTNQICWNALIETEKNNKYFQDALAFVEHERAQGKVIFPAGEDVFSAFSSTKFDQVKVVILGQDPYHGPNQAHGLCFSVLPGIKTPPSLVNIFKELEKDVQGFQIPQHGYLQSWAEQGVLMLNTVLTVEQGKAHSHAKCGWETFTDKMIEALNQYRSDVVFILWGAHAQKKGRFIDRDKHHVLIAPHPSPLSAHRGFFGCQHFSKTNELLASNGIEMIDWNLPLTTK